MLSCCAAATAWSNGESKGSCSNPKPWHTPTVTEIPLDSLPTELRMLALGLRRMTGQNIGRKICRSNREERVT
jgi:hypothetical protein